METHIYYNPLDTACKSTVGGISEKKNVQFSVFLLDNPFVLQKKHSEISLIATDCKKPESSQRCFFHLQKDGDVKEKYEMEQTEYGWTISLSFSEIGLYFYSFYLENIGYISCGYQEIGVLTEKENPFLLTVFSEDYKTPDWFKGGIMYQIFPDRFAKFGTMPNIDGRIQREDWGNTPSFRPNKKGKVLNNDFFGGNFKGIQSKLPYLKELGVTVIYLNPIFEAASNHRYDTSDYMKIDPFLGTEEDFSTFVQMAKEQGIRVILDGVFNHTGDDSVYFNKYGRYPSIGAYQSKDSPYYSWYNFHGDRDHYDSWWGIDILPEINETSKEYREFIFGKDGVLKKWLTFGIGGYRLDVADELPDFFLKELRASVKESDENAIIIGEVWEDASNKIAYSQRREYLQGYELDSVMNYPLKDSIIRYIQTGNAGELLHCIRVLINHYPKQTLDCLMNILGTHDTARILTVLGGIYCNNKEEMAKENAYLTPENKEKTIEKLKMAVVLQYTLPGVPCIYYGDENGAEGHIDPFCRRCFDWEHLNQDLIGFYKNLGIIRKENQEIFKDGNFKDLYLDNGLFYFKREKDKKSIYVFTNNSNNDYVLNFDGKYINLINNEIYENEKVIKANSFGVLKKI